MAPHTRLIAEALTTAALGELADRLFASESGLRRWLDEVSRPPEDVTLDASKTYTGILCILRNRVRRAFVVEHRVDAASEEHNARWQREYFRPSSIGSARRPHFDEEGDEFPGFGCARLGIVSKGRFGFD